MATLTGNLLINKIGEFIKDENGDENICPMKKQEYANVCLARNTGIRRIGVAFAFFSLGCDDVTDSFERSGH